MAIHQRQTVPQAADRLMPSGAAHHEQVVARLRRGRIWAIVFQGAMLAWYRCAVRPTLEHSQSVFRLRRDCEHD